MFEDLIKQSKSERQMAVKDSVIHKYLLYNSDIGTCEILMSSYNHLDLTESHLLSQEGLSFHG